MAALLSDADVGFGAAPKLLSDADVGFKSGPGASASPSTEDYGFDVPSAAAQPKISDAAAPTPPAALQQARDNAPPPVTDIPARIGRALIEGWKSAPDILTPQAQDWLANAERNNPRPNLQDALTVGHAALAAGNAMFRGGLEGIAALGDVAGMPQLGRDVAGYYESMGVAGMPHAPAVFRSTLPETRAYITEQMLADRKAQSTTPAAAPSIGETVNDVMKAPDIDGAIAAATREAGAPAAIAAQTTPDAASIYREAPAAIPPNAKPPVLPRILDLLNEDARVAANRPEFIPPDADQPPPIAPIWGDPFAAKPKVEDVATPEAIPEPESVGAAASRENTPLAQLLAETPAQKATALQKMVTQSAEDRLTPQGRDDAVYVPGVERPESMRDFTPAGDGETSAALAHKVSYNTDTSYHDQFDGLVKKNNAVMVDKLNDMIGDANARDAAMNEAKQLMPGPVGLFDDERPVNAQPIVDRIHEILAGPAGKRGAVESQLNSILPKLFDADGNLESLPSMLKGVRDDITDRLYDKSPTTEGNAARTARNQLQDVLSIIDDTIGSGLPGTKYQDYLANLSAALGQVSKLDYLQKFLTGPRKLTDLAGNLQFNKVQKMLEDIQAHQGDRTGGAKELTWPEINQIEAVRNELAAKDLLDRRAAVRGSPTAQITNAAGVLGGGPLGAMVKGGAEAALHVGLAATTHGIGNAALGGYRYIVKPMMDAAKDKQAAAELAATKQRLLSTDYPAPQ